MIDALVSLVMMLVLAFFAFIGFSGGSSKSETEMKAFYNAKAVKHGCAVLVLDTATAQVKTVWNGEKE